LPPALPHAWSIYELLADGSKKNIGTIRTPDAEDRAKARVKQIFEDEGKVVFAEPCSGPFTHPAQE